MKKLLIALGVIIVLLVAAVLIVPALIPIDTYKEQIANQVREKTGREFAINGDVSLSIIPNVALEVHDVAFGNAEGAREAQMATLDTMQIDVQLLPLLGGELAIDRFVLIEPVINLEVLPNGTANWQLAGMGGGGESGGSAAGGAGLEEVRLGDVRIENGRVTYFDAATGTQHLLSNVNVNVSLPSLSAPFALDGSMVWHDEEITVDMTAEQLKALMEGGSTGVGLNVASNPVNVDYQGTVTGGANGKAEGDVTLVVPSVRNLMAWVGSPMPEGDGFEQLSISGHLAAQSGKASFSEAAINFDAIKGTGEIAIDTSGGVPDVQGRLDVEQLDLNPYLPPAAEGEQDSGPGEWSNDPIDLSVLRSFNADLALSVQGIKAQNITVGRSALTIKVAGGTMTADLTELNLYDGQGKGRIVLDGSEKMPTVTKQFAMTGFQVEPFLVDAAGSDRLSGSGDMSIEVETRGGSQREMVENLNGKGAIDFRDGALKGINIGAMVRNVKSAFLDSGAAEQQKTDFSSLTGTFTIAKGVLANSDLTMAAPLFRVTGAGTANLPARTVDYTVTPKVVASATGQGGDQDLKGIVVPVIVSGPWHDLSYRPDLAAAINPENLMKGAQDAAKGLIPGGDGTGGSAGDMIKGVLGGGGSTPTTEGGTTESGSGTGGAAEEGMKKLKGLFGN